MAARNAALVRLRAKKLALGLDPSVVRLPVLDQVPASLIAAREGDRVRLRVNVRFSRRRQWFFNGKPVDDDDAEDPASLRRGARACTLTLLRMSKRVAGEYYCVCENEEGSAVTPVTRVEMAAKLRADRLAERTLPLAQQHARPTVMRIDGDNDRQVVAVCAPSESDSGGGSGSFTVVLLAAKTLASVRLAPSIRMDGSRAAVAWSDHTQTLAVVTDATPSAAAVGSKSKIKAAKPGGDVQIALYSIGRSMVAAPGQPPRAPNARGPSFRGAQSQVRPKASASGASNSNNNNASGSNTVTAKQLATQTITLAGAFDGGVRAVAFVDSGKLLALTDLHLTVAVYAIDRSQSQPLQLLHTVRSADGARISSATAAADAQ